MSVPIAVGIGGAIGSILRFLLLFVQEHYFENVFPFATLFVNICGSFLLAFLSTSILSKKWNIKIITGINTGLIGSFTTFSTFSMEVITLLNENKLILSAVYMISSLVGGVLFAYLGIVVAKRHMRRIQV